MATTRDKASAEYDKVENLLQTHDVWPTMVTEKDKTHAKSFIFRKINQAQATVEFQNLVLLYQEHTLQVHANLKDFPRLRNYLNDNPLGQIH